MDIHEVGILAAYHTEYAVEDQLAYPCPFLGGAGAVDVAEVLAEQGLVVHLAEMVMHAAEVGEGAFASGVVGAVGVVDEEEVVGVVVEGVAAELACSWASVVVEESDEADHWAAWVLVVARLAAEAHLDVRDPPGEAQSVVELDEAARSSETSRVRPYLAEH